MKWRNTRRSSNVEDHRGRGGSGGSFGGLGGGLGGGGRMPRLPMGRGGSGGLIGIVVIVLIAWAMGINPLQLLGLETGTNTTTTTTSGLNNAPRTGPRPDDELADFAAHVLGDTEDTWKAIFAERGATYRVAILRLYEGGTESGCGFAQSAVGPFYCPADNRVYIDLSFFRDLSARFGAHGDFAQAYVIAHEVAHHVQNLIGVMEEVARVRARVSEREANALSVKVELQADCLAGVWAHHAERKGLLEMGDINEAIGAAEAVGDDRLQRAATGTVQPDSFTHGTSAQRAQWFTTGYQSGRMESCDTFGNGGLTPR
ncbi:MAG TPA: neutral zinc metallopeptidase [Micropepsaceae bacterium]|nr:neutral zinc metallopeptidase [Micropepsaceae bacterium]